MTEKNNYVRQAKYLLKEGDPLIDILKPEFVTVIKGDALYSKSKDSVSSDGGDEDDTSEVTDETVESALEAPFLSDITIVKKEKIRDKNGNDFLRITVNVKNHVGEAVKGVQVYGQ